MCVRIYGFMRYDRGLRSQDLRDGIEEIMMGRIKVIPLDELFPFPKSSTMNLSPVAAPAMEVLLVHPYR